MYGKGLDCLFPLYRPIEGYGDKLRVRCGSCLNCKMFKREEWCLRLQLESKYWKKMCFVTLTYDNEHLPLNEVTTFEVNEDGQEDKFVFRFPTLADTHIHDFIKFLRNHKEGEIHDFGFTKSGERDIRRGFRYFAVGEYGTRFGRPHYHIMFFGIGADKLTQRIMENAWSNGFVQVKPFTPERCVYIAGYVQKKLFENSELQKNIYRFKLREFLRCSQHLGEQYVIDHQEEFDDEHCYFIQNGYKKPVPRQLRKVLIKLGRISEQSQIEMSLRQQYERDELFRNLNLKSADLPDFFRNRLELAKQRNARTLSKRFKTGDI